MNQPENTNPIEEDTEGHAASSRHADAEVAEGDDDVEGHQKNFPAGAEPAEGDEIEGGMRRRRR